MKDDPGLVLLKISDISGRPVASWAQVWPEGSSGMLLDHSPSHPGFYILCVKTADKQKFIRMIIR